MSSRNDVTPCHFPLKAGGNTLEYSTTVLTIAEIFENEATNSIPSNNGNLKVNHQNYNFITIDYH